MDKLSLNHKLSLGRYLMLSDEEVMQPPNHARSRPLIIACNCKTSQISTKLHSSYVCSLQAGVTSECVSAWTRLQYCGLCVDASPPACSRYCHNVLRGCLPAHADIGESWDAYVGKRTSSLLVSKFYLLTQRTVTLSL